MSLAEELHRVRLYLTGTNPPPSNEANTCNRVIRPLLHQSGYDYDDMDEQGHDAAGGIPDYVILPNTAQTWFLEAKAWQVALNDTHVTQACDYPLRQGKRWIVLTNGREWRLYDNFVVGVPPAGRLVVTARLDCNGQVETLLGALSKASVLAGELENYARQSRLNAFLAQQMADANSDVMQAIANVVQNKPGLAFVTPADVMAYFQGHYQPVASNTPAAIPTPPAPISAVHPLPIPQTSSGDGMTLRELKQAGMRVNGRKPETLTLPDSTTKQVFTWRDVALGIIEWLFVHGKMPSIPFSGQRGSKRFFINNDPHFGKTSKDEHKTMTVQGQVFYIHVNRSIRDFVQVLNALCNEVGESPDGFRVTLRQDS